MTLLTEGPSGKKKKLPNVTPRIEPNALQESPIPERTITYVESPRKGRKHKGVSMSRRQMEQFFRDNWQPLAQAILDACENPEAKVSEKIMAAKTGLEFGFKKTPTAEVQKDSGRPTIRLRGDTGLTLEELHQKQRAPEDAPVVSSKPAFDPFADIAVKKDGDEEEEPPNPNDFDDPEFFVDPEDDDTLFNGEKIL